MQYEAVTHTATERPLARLPSGAAVSVTVHRYTGGPGPTVYVQAAQHGIELNGPAALRRLHGGLVDAEVAGTVVVVPVANPPAFDHRSYMAPAAYDARNSNLNRVWPGDEEGTLQERMAARLWGLAGDADAVVDLHTGTPDMLQHVRYQGDDPDARALAEAFGTEHLLADPEDVSGEAPGGEKLRTAAARAGIPAITAELSNSRRVIESATEAGVDGVRNALGELGVLDADPAPPAQSVLRDDPEPTLAAESGLFEPRPGVAVGDRLEAGEELGAVYGPSSFERLETVTVAESGVAYSLTREAVVFAGERLAGVAAPT